VAQVGSNVLLDDLGSFPLFAVRPRPLTLAKASQTDAEIALLQTQRICASYFEGHMRSENYANRQAARCKVLLAGKFYGSLRTQRNI
jgi:hypothetical protein